MKFSIVIPCYNEEKNIPLLVERLRECIKENVEVILVNNGSSDQTEEILHQYTEKFDFVRTVTVPVNQGYGYGILKGLEAAEGDYIGWTHADMQTDPMDVMKGFDFVDGDQDNLFIKGNRKGRPLFDRFFTNGMSMFETIYLGKKLEDVNAQPNIFPRSFFLEWKNAPYDFSLDLYVLYLAQVKNLKIIRFPVLFPERQYGESHWNTGLASKWKFIKRTIDFSIKLKKGGIS
ncbi:MAG: glycosyltransferase family 2 protein [Clostridia bacterium]|nr:glycosyltransferase family 2 protein [Clostridia bacterium]